jgi:hypothetical protein
MTDLRVEASDAKEAIASVAEQRKKAAADYMRSMGTRNRVRQSRSVIRRWTRETCSTGPRGSGGTRRILRAVVRRGHRRRAEVDIGGAVMR